MKNVIKKKQNQVKMWQDLDHLEVDHTRWASDIKESAQISVKHRELTFLSELKCHNHKEINVQMIRIKSHFTFL